MSEETIEVSFTHPKISGDTLTADISPICTGHDALQELMRDTDGSGAFLPPPREGHTYSLSVRRTEQEIGPQMTFAQAGANNGDTIVVSESMIGAFNYHNSSTS